MQNENVWFQKISIPTPWKVIRNSDGEGVSKAKMYKEKYKVTLEIPGGREGGFKRKNLSWGRYQFFLEQHNENLAIANLVGVTGYTGNTIH